MTEDKRTVTFIKCNGEKIENMPIKEAVIAEAKMQGTIEGGRPSFEEVETPKEKRKVEEKKDNIFYTTTTKQISDSFNESKI